MDYPYAKFGRFNFNMRTDRHNRRVTDKITDTDDRYIHETTVGVSKWKWMVRVDETMKTFRSNNSEIVAECRRYVDLNLPSELTEKRKLNSTETTTDAF